MSLWSVFIYYILCWRVLFCCSLRFTFSPLSLSLSFSLSLSLSLLVNLLFFLKQNLLSCSQFRLCIGENNFIHPVVRTLDDDLSLSLSLSLVAAIVA